MRSINGGFQIAAPFETIELGKRVREQIMKEAA